MPRVTPLTIEFDHRDPVSAHRPIQTFFSELTSFALLTSIQNSISLNRWYPPHARGLVQTPPKLSSYPVSSKSFIPPAVCHDHLCYTKWSPSLLLPLVFISLIYLFISKCSTITVSSIFTLSILERLKGVESSEFHFCYSRRKPDKLHGRRYKLGM